MTDKILIAILLVQLYHSGLLTSLANKTIFHRRVIYLKRNFRTVFYRNISKLRDSIKGN